MNKKICVIFFQKKVKKQYLIIFWLQSFLNNLVKHNNINKIIIISNKYSLFLKKLVDKNNNLDIEIKSKNEIDTNNKKSKKLYEIIIYNDTLNLDKENILNIENLKAKNYIDINFIDFLIKLKI